MTSVSVIIVNWNGAEFLGRCLSSLREQTIAPSEIFVVDNASSDGSIDLLQFFPEVRLLKQDSNLGFAKGNNIAIQATSPKSKWIALVNPDVFVQPEWLEKLLLTAESNPTFDIFASKLLDSQNPALLDGAGDIYHFSGRVWRLGHKQPESAEYDQMQEVFSPCAAAALYKRSALFEVGGFDEDFFCYLEDVDLGFRLRLKGYKCLYVPASVAHHVGSGTTGGQHSNFAVYYGHRNLVWTYFKNMPGSLFWIFLPVHLLMNLLSILALTFRGQGKVIVRAKRDAFLGLPKIWKKRRVLQQKRVASISDIWRVLDRRAVRVKIFSN